MSYYRDSLETYFGLTYDFIGILLELSWDTLMSYLWVSSVLSWGLLVLLVAYLWPRKTNQSFKFLVQSQPLQSAGHLYRTTTIIAIRTFQVYTWLSQSTWEKKCLQGSGCGSNLILCFPTATKVTWLRLFVFLRTSAMNREVTWAWRATFLHEHFTYTSNLHQRRTNHKHKCIGSISKTIFSQFF